VRHPTRISAVTVDFDDCVDNQATVSSNADVWPASCRAQGTAGRPPHAPGRKPAARPPPAPPGSCPGPAPATGVGPARCPSPGSGAHTPRTGPGPDSSAERERPPAQRPRRTRAARSRSSARPTGHAIGWHRARRSPLHWFRFLRQLQNLCGNGVFASTAPKNHPRMRQESQKKPRSPFLASPLRSRTGGTDGNHGKTASPRFNDRRGPVPGSPMTGIPQQRVDVDQGQAPAKHGGRAPAPE
jgi:hypothetical protein